MTTGLERVAQKYTFPRMYISVYAALQPCMDERGVAKNAHVTCQRVADHRTFGESGAHRKWPG